jgi:protoporphyrinogen oxidase
VPLDADVLVIGAGPAGLTAAYCLTKQARSVIVVERDPHHVGGISRTVDYKGFLFDIGGHRFFSKSKEVVALWREILPDDFIERPRLSRIYYNGKFFSYPLKTFDALLKLGVATSALCLASYARAKIFPIAPPRSFHEWVRNQFGERLFQIFFKTYTEKVWGMSCDEISADWAAQRIKGLDLGTAIINALRRSLRLRRKTAGADDAAGDTAKTLIESFQYPRKGPGMMWQAAARQIAARGGRILMGRELAALEFDAGRRCWHVETATPDGGRERYTARHVICSAPLREVVERIKPTPISLLHARALRYRDFLTVALMVRKADLFPDNWIYIHDPRVKVGRVQNFRSWSPEMVPEGMSCLGLEYFCFEGDGLWNAADSELVALAKNEAAQIGLVDAADVVDACVVRQAKAYPVYDEGYRDNIAAIRLDLEGSYPGLHLVGRNGMHRYNNQDHAMMTAMLTVRNILAGARVYDVWNVNEDAEYHEAGESGIRHALASVRLVPEKAAEGRAA